MRTRVRTSYEGQSPPRHHSLAPNARGVSIAESFWTTITLCALFDCDQNTLGNYRDNRGLPTIIIPGNSRGLLVHDPIAVMSWGLDRGLKMHPGAAARAHAEGIARIEGDERA